jgi:pteridine reductase
VLWPEGTDGEVIARYQRRVPMDRSGRPEEAAAAVAWALLEASFVTGTTVRVDGGRWLR